MVYNLLQTLKSIKSTNEKRAFVRQHLMNETFFKVLHYTLDPYRVFGIKKIPDHTPGSALKLTDVFDTLDQFALNAITGNAASDKLHFLLSRLSVEDGYVLQRIIDKDLKCGVGTKLINDAVFEKYGKVEALNHYIPTFDTMAAHLYETKKVKWGKDKWYSEPKKDGMRCVYFIESTIEDTICYSRGGKEIETLDAITKEIVELYPSGMVVDGEVITPGNFESAMSIIRRAKKNAKPGEIFFHPFAVLTREEWEEQECKTTYEEIRERIHTNDSAFVRKLPSREVKNEEEAFAHYEECLEAGDEGTILKKADAPYEFKRSGNWLKIKPEETLDLTIVGYYEGVKGTKNEGRLGGFIVDYKGKEVRVGGGYKEKDPTPELPNLVNERQKFWDERDDLIGSIIEVKFMQETADGSLRHPRFMRFRSFKGEKV